MSGGGLDGIKTSTYGIRKHLIDMGINENALPIRRRHKAAPIAKRLKSIVDHDGKIAFLGGSKRPSEKGYCELLMILLRVNAFT